MSVITSLVAYWALDEASGNASDAHGSATLTDNGSRGTRTGLVSGARDFAGTGAAFSRTDDAALSLGADTAFSFAGWALTDVDATNRVILAKGGSSGPGTGSAYYLYQSNTGGAFSLTVGNGSSSATVSDTSAFAFLNPPYNVWHFVAVWHDPATDVLGMQIDNGTPITAAWSGGTQDEAGNFTFGYEPNWLLQWDGGLDEWGFWKKVLTSDERTWLYNSGNGRSYADIVAENAPASPARIIFQKA